VLSEIGFGKLVILSTHIVSDVESIATEIAVMKSGSLLTMTTPEALLRTCEGHVWQSVVASEQFDQLRTTLKISSAVRKPDGVHIRFVGPSPAIAANAAEPELEDAFLYLMNYGDAAQPPPLS
jgi:ABC-type multidrug transport system ATPase subunit